MEMLNRSAVVVRPREPYLHWAKKDDSSGVAEGVFEDLRSTPSIYLIREDEEVVDPNELVKRMWSEIFKAMLENWVKLPELWPSNRTKKMFDKWFEVQVFECVFDLVEGEHIEKL